MTVKQLLEFIEKNKIPSNFIVTGYEGEGGSWILFRHPLNRIKDYENNYYELNTND